MKPCKEVHIFKVIPRSGDIPACGGHGVVGLSRGDETFRVVYGILFSLLRCDSSFLYGLPSFKS